MSECDLFVAVRARALYLFYTRPFLLMFHSILPRESYIIYIYICIYKDEQEGGRKRHEDLAVYVGMYVVMLGDAAKMRAAGIASKRQLWF